jgi:hypothetical protein
MKRLIYSIFALICIAFSSFSKEGIQKQKKIAERYTVGKADNVYIDNQYGKVHVSTWDQNIVTIDVTITAVNKSETKAQEMLDKVSIQQSGNTNGSHTILYKTIIRSNNIKLNTIENIQIDYVIHIPKTLELEVKNKFGDVYLADHAGKLNLNVSYGTIKTESLTNENILVRVAFGGAYLSGLRRGTVESSYSGLYIGKADEIHVVNKFGNTEIGNVKNLTIEQKYGSLEIASVERIKGEASFSDVGIDRFSKSLDMIMKYCSKADLGEVGADVEFVKIDAFFSSLYFKMKDNASLKLDMNITFGDFHSAGLKSFNLKETKENSTLKNYKGLAGKGLGNMLLNVTYGNVYF